jgi:hypothetical protein
MVVVEAAGVEMVGHRFVASPPLTPLSPLLSRTTTTNATATNLLKEGIELRVAPEDGPRSTVIRHLRGKLEGKSHSSGPILLTEQLDMHVQ